MTKRVKHHAIRLSKLVILLFACVGFGFIAMFFAIKWNITNTAGVVDANNEQFATFRAKQAEDKSGNNTTDVDDIVDVAETTNTSVDDLSIEELESTLQEVQSAELQLQTELTSRLRVFCTIRDLNNVNAPLSSNLYHVYAATQSQPLIEAILFNYNYTKYLEDSANYTNEQRSTCLSELQNTLSKDSETDKEEVLSFPEMQWTQNEEWNTIATAIIDDAETITRAAETAGIEPRLLTAPLVVEQLRLFHTQRALFKQLFEPLSILASATKTSWGVMSIKEQTAIAIEQHLKDADSPYYLGEAYEDLLDFSTNNPSAERYDRLTKEDDHFYAYLYGALYIRQLLTQWEQAGYPIDDKPEIVATLFNIGFNGSQPKANPEVGGASISISGTSYTFGSLAFEYYYSTLFIDHFYYENY